MEKVEIVNGEFETTGTSLINKIILVKFRRKMGDEIKEFLTEGIVLNQNEFGIKLQTEGIEKDREEWFMPGQVEILYMIGQVYKNWRNRFVKQYY